MRHEYIPDGSILHEASNPQDTFGVAKYRKLTSDVVGDPGNDHPFTVEERDGRDFNPLNTPKTWIYGNHKFDYHNLLPAYYYADGHVPPSKPQPSIGTLATTLLARSNPSREEVSIPNFIYELKDLPGMFRDLKRLRPVLRNLRHRHSSALSGVASQYLGWEFGWKPLISDLSQLLQFQAQVDRRSQELRRLYSGSGLKRRLNLWEDVNTSEAYRTVESGAGFAISSRIKILTRRRVWGTVRWIPTVVPRDIGNQQLGRTARRLVHGLHHNGIDASQAWEALPFSWLADWFGNMGEFLQSTRNDIPATHGPCNIMTLTESYAEWVRDDPWMQDLKGADGRVILRTKERAQSNGTLSAHLPFATARQFSILAALNLQRKKR